MSTHTLLSSSLVLPCGQQVPNRIVKASMAEGLATPDGAPTAGHARLYERWARGGAGLLFTGNVMVSREGMAERGNVLAEERHLPALGRWAEAAHRGGAAIWMQINHAGRQVPRSMNRRPVAPSAVAMRGTGPLFAKPRALTHDEILTLVGRFASTAHLAQRAGFDGVELHGAHGYLVTQFLSPRTNTRDDAWGGDAARRMRFPLEVVRAMRARVGPRFPIGVKLNSADFQKGGSSLEDAALVLHAFEDEGVDLVEISGGSYEAPEMMGNSVRASTLAREAYFLDAAKALRGATRIPFLVTGGFRSARGMEEALASSAVDLVGLARPLAIEPDLPTRLLVDPDAQAMKFNLRTGLRKIDDMLQIFWHQAQIQRMARGMEPKTTLSKLRALMHGAVGSFPQRTPRGRPQAMLTGTA